jgi:nucleotide-binding universal stress UspA family protein
MYDRILVPTDGSPGSGRAIRHGIELAGTYDATLHALYVAEQGDAPAGGESAGEGPVSRRVAALDPVRERADAAGVDFVGDLRHGDPAEEILACVDAASADLVVMGTHGRTGLERHLLGSVTERVVRAAPVPVVTVGLRGSDEAIDSESEARSIARAAVSERYDAVDLDAGAYREQYAWVLEGTADGRRVTVYVDRATGDPHVVVPPLES